MSQRTWVGGTNGNYGTAGNWLEAAVPVNADDVVVPASSTRAIDAGLNQSAVVLASFRVEAGFTPAIGLSTANLQVNVGSGRFEFSGSGIAYIDVGNSTGAIRVQNTAGATTGGHGLYLIGSALSVVECEAGDLGVAARSGETSTATTVRAVGSGAKVWLGDGVTVTNVQASAGATVLRCAATTVTVNGGTLSTEGVGAITTLNVNGGKVSPESTGTITTATLNGGSTDFTTSGAARTVTTLAQNAGSTLIYDPAVLTITNRSAPSGRVRLTAIAA